MNIGRLRFRPEPHSCNETNLCTYVVEVNERTRYMEIVRKYKIKETLTIETDHVITYTSDIGDRCQALPRHMQRLVGNIPDLEFLDGSEENEEQDLIVATDGSVVVGVGYHRWVVATDNEKVLLKGGGPNDGDQLLMTSYRSELGGIASGLAVLDTLGRSGKIKVKSVKLVCDNEAAVKVCTRKITQSVFHRTKGDHNLVTKIQYLQDTWCQDVDIKYEWVKGHADDLDREPTKCERLNIVAEKICDVVRASAQGTYRAKPNCVLWPNERCALFIRGIQITSNWKERLTQQLLDGDLQEYLMEKEQWTTHSFQNICWKRHETALKRISKARQAQTAKMCHNKRYTGARHAQWYGEGKICYMCGDNEDWRHVLTCKSFDAELVRVDS
jgi:ribonuclease HI